MDKSILFGIAGLMVGLVIGFFITPSLKEQQFKTHIQMMNQNMAMQMNDMSSSLKGKNGDDFDRTFITEMIVHHQGAIDMAKMASQSAKHQEIKDLSKAIIDAQTSEINEMKKWQKEWNYEK